MCMCACACVRACVRARVCVLVCLCACVHVCVCACVHVHVCACVFDLLAVIVHMRDGVCTGACVRLSVGGWLVRFVYVLSCENNIIIDFTLESMMDLHKCVWNQILIQLFTIPIPSTLNTNGSNSNWGFGVRIIL